MSERGLALRVESLFFCLSPSSQLNNLLQSPEFSADNINENGHGICTGLFRTCLRKTRILLSVSDTVTGTGGCVVKDRMIRAEI